MISEVMRDLVCEYGQAKYLQAGHKFPETKENSIRTFDALIAAIAKLEEKARKWDMACDLYVNIEKIVTRDGS